MGIMAPGNPPQILWSRTPPAWAYQPNPAAMSWGSPVMPAPSYPQPQWQSPQPQWQPSAQWHNPAYGPGYYKEPSMVNSVCFGLTAWHMALIVVLLFVAWFLLGII